MKKHLLRISKKHRLFCAALIVALFSVMGTNATTYYAIASGNWNINTTWSLSSAGAAVGVGIWPVAGDIVYIGEANTADRAVTIPAGYGASCAKLTIGPTGATGDKIISLTLASATASLAVSGDIVINRAVSGGGGAKTQSLFVNAGTVTAGGHVSLNGNYTQPLKVAQIVITTGSLTISGNLTCNTNLQASVLVINMSGGAGTLNLGGSFTINNNLGTLTPGTSSTFNFNGTAVGQNIPIGVSSVVYNNLNINNTYPGGATLSAAITGTNVTGNISVQTGTFNNSAFAINLASGKNFSVANGATFKLTGTSAMVGVSGGGTKTFGPTSTVHYAGANQAVSAETYGHLAFSGSGTKTLTAGTTTVLGNWTNDATVNATTNLSTVRFNGSTAQTIGGSISAGFYNLTLDNPAGAVLGNNETVTSILTLTNGSLSSGSFTLDLTNDATGAITGISSTRYIKGRLNRAIAAGANTYAFPVGTASVYAPVSIDFKAGTEPGSLRVSTTSGDHGSITTSTLNPNSSVNRTWTFTLISGLSTVNYDATFNWAGSDQDGAFDYTTALAGKYTDPVWTYPALGTILANSLQIIGQNSFSDFQIADNKGPVTIAPELTSCIGSLISVPVTVTSFTNVGAISLTLNYDYNVIAFDSYEDNSGMIDNFYFDETGTGGIIRFSGISSAHFDLADYSVLITLKFNYLGGSTTLAWDDSEETMCEYATGSPDYIPYPDDPPELFYINGTVTETSLSTDFSADNRSPAVGETVQLTGTSTGDATAWLWSFDRPANVEYVSGSATSQSPQVKFTDGGLYTVTLTATKPNCTATETKVGYIHAGTPGLWDGATSADWNTATNWDDHVVPSATINVLIPTIPLTTNYYPHIPGDLTIGSHCNSITLTGDATLTVDGLLTVSFGKILEIQDNATVHATGF